MKKTTLFDVEGFLNFFATPFEPFSHTTKALIKNIVNLGLREYNTAKDQLVYFLNEMLPFCDEEDIATFCDISILSPRMYNQAVGSLLKRFVPENSFIGGENEHGI